MATSKKKSGRNTVAARNWLAATRIGLGFIFLWAFLDKLVGLGFSTPVEQSWLSGASPSTGYLSNVAGPLGDFFQSLAGVAVVDWLFMLGLLGVGVALIVGAGVRIAAATGALLMSFMYLASLPLMTNPVIDDHIIYALILIVIGYSVTDQTWSIGGWWRSLSFVKARPYLW